MVGMNSNQFNKRVELYLGWSCVNDCIFCLEQENRKKFKQKIIGLEKIKNVLINERKDGANCVTFLGGEPTIQPHFFEAICLAKSLDYRVGITTNGFGFNSKSFCKKVIPFLDDIIISVHGHRFNIHDQITQRKGSFNQLKQSLTNLCESSFDGFLKTNTVINSFNYKHLLPLIKFIESFDIKSISLAALEPPTSKELKLLNKIKIYIPKLQDLESYLFKALDYCDKHNLEVNVADIPFCCLGSHLLKSDYLYYDSRVKISKDGIKHEMKSRPLRSRKKLSQCQDCKFNKLCGGFFEGYFHVFGNKEIKPIK